MELDGLVQYVAGVASGGIGTALLGYWLSGRQDEKKARRDRELHDIAAERVAERERAAEQRSRDIVRVGIARQSAYELKRLADEALMHRLLGPTTEPSYLHLPPEEAARTAEALSELSRDGLESQWRRLLRVTLQLEHRYMKDDGNGILGINAGFTAQYKEFVRSLNELERTL